jgi:3-phenylpropionate/cinnamic acid dioxygenase small subunit
MTADDRLALSDLVHRYAAGVDDRRFDDVVALFDDDATLSLPDLPGTLEPVAVHRGLAEIRTAIGGLGRATRTQHAIVGEVYTIAAESTVAQGRIGCIAHHWIRQEDDITVIAWHLRYDDEYIRTDSGWRISRRTLTIDAIDKRPVRRLRPDGP